MSSYPSNYLECIQAAFVEIGAGRLVLILSGALANLPEQPSISDITRVATVLEDTLFYLKGTVDEKIRQFATANDIFMV